MPSRALKSLPSAVTAGVSACSASARNRVDDHAGLEGELARGTRSLGARYVRVTASLAQLDVNLFFGQQGAEKQSKLLYSEFQR